MSFVTLEQIKPFINKGFYDKLNSDFTAAIAKPPTPAVKWFDKIVPEIDNFINNLTDIDTPASSDNTPNGFIMPVAKLFEYFLLTHFTDLNPDNRERITKDFDQAKQLLIEYSASLSFDTFKDKSKSFTKKMNNLYEF